MNDRDFIINLNNTGGAASQFLVYDALNQSMVDMTEASQIFINRNNADIDFSVRSMIAGEGIALDGGTGDLTLGNSGANVITPGLTNGLLIADGSGVLSTTNLTSDVPNIYTADGTLTGTRTLTSTSSDKLIYNLTQGSDHIINLDAVGTIAPSNSSRFTITDPQGILFEVEDTDGIDDGSIAVEINPAGNDRDFKVQGDTDQNLLFADASVDAMGIGTNNLTATSGGSTPPKLTIEGNPATNTNVLDTHGDGTSYNHFFSHGGPSILRLNRSGGTRAAPTASLGQTHGRIDFGAHNGTDYINNLAGIRARGTGSFSGLDLSTSDVDLSFWTKNNRRLTISPDGNVGIGTTNITQRLTVRDDTAASVAKFKNNDASNDADVLTLEISNLGNAATSNSFINFRRVASTYGSITGDGAGGISYNTTSDRRIKSQIETFSGVLNRLEAFRAVSYVGKNQIDKPLEEKTLGVIAQELYEVFPQLVTKPEMNAEGPLPEGDKSESIWTVNYDKLGAIALQGLKELKAENDVLKAKLVAINLKVENLQNKNLQHKDEMTLLNEEVVTMKTMLSSLVEKETSGTNVEK